MLSSVRPLLFPLSVLVLLYVLFLLFPHLYLYKSPYYVLSSLTIGSFFFLISFPHHSLQFFSDSVPNYLHSHFYISFLSLSFTTMSDLLLLQQFCLPIIRKQNPPHIVCLNTDPSSSELLNSHQAPKSRFFLPIPAHSAESNMETWFKP